MGYYSKLPKGHVDGQPWSGSLEDLAHEQGRTFGGGSLANAKELRMHVEKSKKLATGKDSTPLTLSENELRVLLTDIIRETLS